ncbi:MAG: LysR family transcriptional regulator [Eubacteriales bacterium]|nr:LysR family transcriptional regulator [Eubacteriales bacterium]MCI6979397.1 LysR family transcriptional regulator [Clostridiales bacterium]MDD6722107.1 LysR family transcriptional regulator [Clostridiales bacterium]MDY5693776.1 LysR family transcriptional regulator [Eubacteriales bacterium]HZK46006.1 LysR family transcriptional regulator [Clostridia bacterium]
MLGTKMETLLAVVEYKNFTKAAEALALTQPAVSHHISQLEEELGAVLFVRSKGGLKLTPQGEIAVKYARRLKALDQKLHRELINVEKSITNLRIGITHTAESNLTTQVLAKCANQRQGLSITITTDTIKNLYEMLENYEIDLAIVEGSPTGSSFSSLMLDTDYLVCAMAVTHRLANHAMVTLSELKGEQMILRLPSSATRALFESTLESINDSIENFNVTIEVDNIATIKDLVRKELGVSILPKSACMDELGKGKLAALPIENLSMVRETRIVYNRDFSHFDILQEITKTYQETAKNQRG